MRALIAHYEILLYTQDDVPGELRSAYYLTKYRWSAGTVRSLTVAARISLF